MASTSPQSSLQRTMTLPSGREETSPAARDDDDRSDRLLADLLKDGIVSARWSLDNISAKGRSTLAAGAVVLGLAITGILGFAGLLGGRNTVESWSLGGLQLGMRNVILSLGVACLASVSFSIYYSVRALKTIKVRLPAKYGAFTKSGRAVDKISDTVIEAWASLQKRAMFRRIHIT